MILRRSFQESRPCRRRRSPLRRLARMSAWSALSLACMFALAAFGANPSLASTSYGDLNNFDVFNDTGQECHGFEIELDDIHSTDITYTYDWNHYGTPRITEDLSDPANPIVSVRYASAQNSDVRTYGSARYTGSRTMLSRKNASSPVDPPKVGWMMFSFARSAPNSFSTSR